MACGSTYEMSNRLRHFTNNCLSKSEQLMCLRLQLESKEKAQMKKPRLLLPSTMQLHPVATRLELPEIRLSVWGRSNNAACSKYCCDWWWDHGMFCSLIIGPTTPGRQGDSGRYAVRFRGWRNDSSILGMAQCDWKRTQISPTPEPVGPTCMEVPSRVIFITIVDGKSRSI
jgi:hypothetical protein